MISITPKLKIYAGFYIVVMMDYLCVHGCVCICVRFQERITNVLVPTPACPCLQCVCAHICVYIYIYIYICTGISCSTPKRKIHENLPCVISATPKLKIYAYMLYNFLHSETEDFFIYTCISFPTTKRKMYA